MYKLISNDYEFITAYAYSFMSEVSTSNIDIKN